MRDFHRRQFRDGLTSDIHRRMHQRFHHRRHSGPGGIVMGTAILLVGVQFLLQNFGLVQVHRVWEYWPVILIAWGVAGATGAGRASGRVWGSVITVVGVFLLLGNLHIISENVWRILWPLLLIGLGLRML